jgi:molybdopterin molybdotransferase
MGLMSQPLLPLDEALTLLAGAIPAPIQGAIRADRDDPALDRSTMDGVALRSEDGLAPRRVLGTLFAGDDPAGWHVSPGTCVRIMTGAVLPEGANAVVPVEQIREVEGCLLPETDPHQGDFIRRRGSQARAGDLLLPEGIGLNATRLGLRAQVGEPQPPFRRIQVGVAPTGDELVLDPEPHQIRDSNGPMLAALAHALGAEVRILPSIPDDPKAIQQFLQNLGPTQVLVTAGGVSMGEKDFLPAVLAQLGARILFHRIRLKPGKPMLAALLEGRVILCLPGNPVSAYLNTLLFLPVVLARLEGRALPMPWRTGQLTAHVPNPGDRPLLHPCKRRGELLDPLPSRGSADLVRLAQADVCAWIPEGGMAAGDTRFLELL